MPMLRIIYKVNIKNSIGEGCSTHSFYFALLTYFQNVAGNVNFMEKMSKYNSTDSVY